jgi:hypothetical protein
MTKCVRVLRQPSRVLPLASRRPWQALDQLARAPPLKQVKYPLAESLGSLKRYSLLPLRLKPKRSNLAPVQKVAVVTEIAITVIAVATVKIELRVAIIQIAQRKLLTLASKTKIDLVKKVVDVTVMSEMNVIRSKTEMIKQSLNRLKLLYLI